MRTTALLVLLMTPTFVSGDATLVVRLETVPQVELGHGLPATVTIRNVGNSVATLDTTTAADGFPIRLRIRAQNEKCGRTLVPLRGKASVRSATRTILMPGEVFRFELPSLNKNVLYHGIWNYPGSAMLTVEYVVPTDIDDADLWRGTAESDSEVIAFLAPSDDEVTLRRKELEECVASGAFACHQIIGYFAAVSDSAAADLLVRMLERHPYLTFVANAVVAQTRPADVMVLERAANDPSADGRYLRAAASALRKLLAGTCAEFDFSTEEKPRPRHRKE